MNVIPRPLKLEESTGKINFSSSTEMTGEFDSVRAFAVNMLCDVKGEGRNTVCFKKDDAFEEEEYSIEKRSGDVIVKAKTEKGAFYAVMTMKQLSSGRGYFENVKIHDKPKYAYRGFMLDSARHFWSVDKIKQMIDVMANLKMNVFHWHLTDDQGWRIEIKKYPLLTEKGSIRKDTPLSLYNYWNNKEEHDGKEYGRGLFYTQDEAREIVAYAKERQIDVMPEIDMPGHMVAAISCYPHLSCKAEETQVSNRWGVMDNILCCGNDEVYEFAKDIIDEIVDIFPYKYFHIGGDEAPKKRWKECPKCQAKMKELGLKSENALQSHFNNVMLKHLNSKGKSMIGWNEILDAQEILEPEVIAQWWTNYHPAAAEKAKRWMKSGGKTILSLVNYVYMDHAFAIRPLSKTYGYSYRTMGLENDDNVAGMEIPQWTEYIRDEEKFDMNTYPRLITFAEVCWSDDSNKNYEDFERRFENMRGYFKKSYGFELPHQKVYRGKTTPWYSINKNKYWVKDPYFEVKFNRELMKNGK